MFKALAGNCLCTVPLNLPEEYAEQALVITELFKNVKKWPPVIVLAQSGLGAEAYHLIVEEDSVKIIFSSLAGLFYGLVSLGQLAMQGTSSIPCCCIEDAPAMPVRGFMHDISRGKVARLETLIALANKMAMLKMNHFELYLEGFSFAYPSFPELWASDTAITPQELRQLDAYCRTLHIELVPNQNSLGHMADWLALPQFSALAENADGYEIMGFKIPSTTLNPKNPGSLALVAKLADDLLPNFTSKYFNVGLDEPFELGQGENRIAQQAGQIGQVYIDYVLRLHEQVTNRGKRMMMWGDIVAKHAGLVNQLPKDIVVLEWGYEAEHPFEERAAALEETGLDFLVCPGTSSWSSYGGITANMLQNVRTAAAAAHKHGAKGILLTDWGDGGHPQYLPISYTALVLAAALLAWQREPMDEERLAAALNAFIFMDEAGVMGQLMMDLGRCGQFEECKLPCRTYASMVGMLGLVPAKKMEASVAGLVQGLDMFVPPIVQQTYFTYHKNRKPFNHAGQNAWLEDLAARVTKAKMSCVDSDLVKREVANTVAELQYLGNAHAYITLLEGRAADEEKACLQRLVQDAQGIAETHTAVWQARNKPYGLEGSLGALLRLQAQAKEKLKI